MNRRFGFAAVALVLGLVFSLVLAEGAAQFYVYFIAKRPKLFEPDVELGWVLLPNLDLTRNNTEDGLWHIETNSRGFRSPTEEFDEGAPFRVLVLGDSFVFGQGVQIEERFDSRIQTAHPEWSIVNQGVMGYGTDQQLIAAREDMKKLRAGDVLLIISYQNDLVDILRHEHSGRAKPWFEIQNGELIGHPPDIGFAETVRDQSYLLARILTLVGESAHYFEPAQLRVSGHVYRRLIEERTAELSERGVNVVIAYHASLRFDDPDQQVLRQALENTLSRVCKNSKLECVALDDAMMTLPGRSLFLRDGHWNAAGHAVVGKTLDQALSEIAAPR